MLITSILLAFRGDVLAQSATEKIAVNHAYDLVGWHLVNIHSKWTHWVRDLIPGVGMTESERMEAVGRYFELGDEIGQLNSQLVSAGTDKNGDAAVEEMEGLLQRLRGTRLALRNDVEEAIESEISTVIRSQRLGLAGEVVLPPVDVRLEAPPMVLVTSPRDRIERLSDVLLDSQMAMQSREELEEQVSNELDLSPLVLEVGGVATYPASVHHGADLRNTLRLAAHEWVHHYLFLKPLGRNPYGSAELLVLNETVAGIAGDEIGDLTYSAMQDKLPEKSEHIPDASSEFHVADLAEHTEIDFGALMRETRETTDRLLAEGEVERAEAYMEEQRQVLIKGGHPIRKLNQAYFAFYGTYAHGPASIDPIGPQMRRLRELSKDVGEFLTLAGSITSSDELLELLDRMGPAGSS